MPRIRTIKPEFWTDDAIVELEFVTRLLFIGLWNFVDDEGYIENKPRQIKMKVLPADDVLTEHSLNALVRAGMLHEFQSDQGPLLRVANWERHQKINRPNPTRFTGIAPQKARHSVSAHGVRSESHLPEKEKEKEKEKETTPKGVVPRKRGTRIPDPFVVTAEMWEWAAERAPLVDGRLSTERFVNYWRAKTRDATKLDWLGTWQNWLLKDQQDAERQQKGRRLTPTERAQQTVQAGRRVAGQQITSLDPKEIAS